jgi:flagellar biosynthesis chaperone FliJ
VKRRFEFRLARLLRVRAIEEELARAALARAEAEARSAAAVRERAAHELARGRSELVADLATGTIRPARVLLAQRALGNLAVALRARLERERTLVGQASVLRAAWRARETDRRALVELESRAHRSHRAELERRENAALDEVAQRRARQVRRPGSESDSSRPGWGADESAGSPSHPRLAP